jgi:hypothetical protein
VEYRPIPSRPGYSVSLCGVVLRDRLRANGAPYFLKIVPGPTPKVTIAQKALPVDRLVAEAWGELAPPVTSVVYNKDVFRDRPASSYEDGRVLHITEFLEERRMAQVVV